MSQKRESTGCGNLRKNAGRPSSRCAKLFMDMILLPPDFREFLQLLNLHAVRYLLVGGYAVGYYGYPRATADIDIWVGTDKENVRRVLSVLDEFGFAGVEPSVFAEQEQVIRMGVPPLRIELLTGISGVEFEECYSRRVVVSLSDAEVSIIRLEDLKANKAASGRYKDLNDLEHLP